MKKWIAVAISLLCLSFLNACRRTSPVKTTPQTIQISERWTGGEAKRISEKDTETLLNILNNDKWIPETPNCACDCTVELEEQIVYYHSSCGTFNIRTDSGHWALETSDEEKQTVNSILEKYIVLQE